MFSGTGNCSAGFGPVSIGTANPSIVPTGATQDSSKNWDILVGQKFTPTVTGLPAGVAGPPPSYQWTAPGTTFQTWQNTTPAIPATQTSPAVPANLNASYHVLGPGDLTLATPIWYWNNPMGQTAEPVACTVSYSPPPGQGQGNSFSISLNQPVTVYLPNFNATGYPGYCQVNGSDPYIQPLALWAGPTMDDVQNHHPFGMTWSSFVTTPQSPAAFGSGIVQYVQQITPDYSYSTDVASPPHVWPQPPYASTGLDTIYPYASGTFEGTEFKSGDSPGIQLLDSMSSASIMSDFVVYLMYMPPGPNSMWVPLANFQWNASGSATLPSNGHWSYFATQNSSDFAGLVTPTGPFTPDNTFPMWTAILIAPQQL